MKKSIAIILLLSATGAMAQQGPQQRRNPRLDSLITEKDPVVLQQRVDKLKRGGEEDLGVLLQYYNAKERTGDADSLFEAIVKNYPNGHYAAIDMTNKIYQVKSGKKQEEMFKSFLVKFPGRDVEMTKYSVANAYIREKNTAKAMEYVNQMKPGSFRTMSVGIIAEEMMKYDNKTAEAMVKKEMENAKQDLTNIDVNRAANDRLYNPRADYYRFVNLYGKILMQKKDYAGALKYMGEAYDSTPKKDLDIQRNYGMLLSKTGQYKKAFPVLDSITRDGQGDAELKKELLIAYAKLNPGKDVNAYLAEVQAALASRTREQVVKTMISEVAPAFVVKDVNGKEVSLADFKGKTIVLDFWATWCGPCKRSFPAMQLAVDRYSRDANVKFLFIHTWERSEEPQAEAKEYLSENKYRFDLYMDLKDPATKMNNAVSMFKVKAIPAKFVIDGDGKIRFKVSGFAGGDDAAAEELSAMIELAKKKD